MASSLTSQASITLEMYATDSPVSHDFQLKSLGLCTLREYTPQKIVRPTITGLDFYGFRLIVRFINKLLLS